MHVLRTVSGEPQVVLLAGVLPHLHDNACLYEAFFSRRAWGTLENHAYP